MFGSTVIDIKETNKLRSRCPELFMCQYISGITNTCLDKVTGGLRKHHDWSKRLDDPLLKDVTDDLNFCEL